jgi:hypothetical protein
MNPNETLDRLQERCDKAEAALREAQRELADYGRDMEDAHKRIAMLRNGLEEDEN